MPNSNTIFSQNTSVYILKLKNESRVCAVEDNIMWEIEMEINKGDRDCEIKLFTIFKNSVVRANNSNYILWDSNDLEKIIDNSSCLSCGIFTLNYSKRTWNEIYEYHQEFSEKEPLLVYKLAL